MGPSWGKVVEIGDGPGFSIERTQLNSWRSFSAHIAANNNRTEYTTEVHIMWDYIHMRDH